MVNIWRWMKELLPPFPDPGEHREAMLRAGTRIEVDLGDEDILVLMSERVLSAETVTRIQAAWKFLMESPQRPRLLVLEDRMTYGVIHRKEDGKENYGDMMRQRLQDRERNR